MGKINKAAIKNFTVFEEADIDFAGGVNVFIGENGTGKTHLLKLLYIWKHYFACLSNDRGDGLPSDSTIVYKEFFGTDNLYNNEKEENIMKSTSEMKKKHLLNYRMNPKQISTQN